MRCSRNAYILARSLLGIAIVALWASSALACGAPQETAPQQTVTPAPFQNFDTSIDFLKGQDEVHSPLAAKPANTPAGIPGLLAQLENPAGWTSPEGIGSSLQFMLVMAVLSLAPAIVMMTTSFVRIVVVLGLLRQALGTQQLPPSQVLTSIALFMTLAIMAPVWTDVYQSAIRPYSDHEITLEQAWETGTEPVRRFMSDQIRRLENDDDVYLFLRYLPASKTASPPSYAYYQPEPGQQLVPLQALVPAFMLSELKTAFLIGFQIYLPFVILDLVVATISVSMGMMMLPPVLISLPLKLLLFVLVDGWHLVVEMLLESFVLYAY